MPILILVRRTVVLCVLALQWLVLVLRLVVQLPIHVTLLTRVVTAIVTVFILLASGGNEWLL